MKRAIKIHGGDNVAVALTPLRAGEAELGVTLAEAIPSGHKFSLCPISEGTAITKYGLPIGYATADIAPGAWVHTHNVRTGLDENAAYVYAPSIKPLPALPPESAKDIGVK